MNHFLAMSVVGLSLVACQSTTGENSVKNTTPAWVPIIGKTLVKGDLEVTIHRDGTIKGPGIEGTWRNEAGKYCRTMTKPVKFAGTECAIVTVNGDLVVFDNQKGRTSTWKIQ